MTTFRMPIGMFALANGSSPTPSNHPCDATNDAVAFLFQALTADPITHVCFRYGTRIGTGSPPTYAVELEGIDGSGNPDGVDLGGGSPTLTTFTPPASTAWDGTWREIALTNAFSPTVGQWIYLTIRYNTGTIDSNNASSFTTNFSNLTAHGWMPGTNRLTGGTWQKQGTTLPSFGVITSNGRYGSPALSTFQTRTASTIGHRAAMKFNFVDIASTYAIRKVQIVGSTASATGRTPKVGLWNSAGTMLQEIQFDTEYLLGNASDTWRQNEFTFDESTLANLVPGTDYYIGYEVADATSGGVIVAGVSSNANADLNAWPGGTSWIYSTWNGSAWTDTPTVRPLVNLVLDDITKPSGSGGSIIAPMRVIQSIGRRR